MVQPETLTEKFTRLERIAKECEDRGSAVPWQSDKRKASHDTRTTDVESAAIDEDFQRMLKRHKAVIDNCEKEEETRRSHFINFKAKIENLRGAYLYGLKKISDLKDLQNAPDAIMAGNFPEEAINTSAK